MSLIKTALNVISGGLIGDIGKAIDDNVTSDEERGKLKNALAEINAKSKAKTQEFLGLINQELTKRHSADMMSDSWLSKNIRPLTLIVLTIVTILYLLFGPENQDRYEAGLALLASLDMMVYGFYFGSRGVEKAAGMIATALNNRKKKKKEDDEDDYGELGW